MAHPIEQALQRAREEGQTKLNFGQSREVTQPPSLKAVDTPTPLSTSEIKYWRTQSWPLTPQQLLDSRIVVGSEETEGAAAFNILRTRIMQKMQVEGWQTLVVTSARDNAGKSFVAANLAAAMARDRNHTVMLVDADMRRPSIHQFFNYPLGMGLADLVRGNITVEEILFHPGIDRLVVLPGGQSIPDSAEWMASPEMEKWLQEAVNRYGDRLIIIDAPPLLSVDDTLNLLPKVDAFLLVVDEGGVSESDVAHCLELTKDAELLGTVLNRSMDPQPDPY